MMIKLLTKKNLLHLGGAGILASLLILIRAFQTQLFYDPLLDFFANDSTEKVLPNYDQFQLYSNIIYRYALNSTISVGIIALLFNNKSITVTSIKIYAIAGVLLLLAYMTMIENNLLGGEKMVFYIRRFLIQPLLLLILIPAYYFILNKENKENKEIS